MTGIPRARLRHPFLRTRFANSSESGAVAAMIALLLVPILGTTALVADLGQLRTAQRSIQSAADLAALAAGTYLAGLDGVAPNPRAACVAAFDSTAQNLTDRPSSGSLTCTSLPTAVDSTTCPTLTVKTLTSTGTDPYSVSITFPVTAASIADSRFASTGVNDGTSACERMKVQIARKDSPVFGRILGGEDVNHAASAVVRALPPVEGEGVAALLLLERVGCEVLQTSGGGSMGAGAVVQAPNSTTPGVIHTDSIGQITPCTTNSNASGYVIYGTALPNAAGSGPSIISQAASSGTPGVIRMRAIAVGGRAAAVVGTGVSPAPISGPVISRRPADNKYNKPTSAGGRAQLSALHSSAYALATMTNGAANGAGYRVLSGNNACNGLNTSSSPVTETKVFVNCPNFIAGTTIFPNATDVVFAGNVSVPNNKLLSLPKVARLSIRGCVSSCSGGNDFAISVAGELRTNTGGDGTTGPACSTRKGPGSGGTVTTWTQIATFSGPFLVTGQVRLCQTFVYLGDNTSTYSAKSQTAVGVAPENYPALVQCSTVRPCPSDATSNGYIAITGGAGSADWTPPNQLSVQPTYATFATSPFEDLALWTETNHATEIKGQGANRTEGVFFVPNASMTFTGQATQTQPLEAQFIARRLNISSQGSLFLKPNSSNSVLTPQDAVIELIR